MRASFRPRIGEAATIALLPRLPETRDELVSVARSLRADPEKTVYVGRDASERTVATLDLSATRVISFATHGLAAGEIDGLFEPALALSAPDVTGDEKNDGFLTMTEILGLRLDADWVVLSACNTAASDGRGAEAVSGLCRAFFHAGARSIMASHWPVHSLSTTELMSRVFSAYANGGISRTEALRVARLSLIRDGAYTDAKGAMLYSYAHPIFWAPFTLVGDGGGTSFISG